MYKIIFKTSIFYYLLASMIVFKCINFQALHDIRLGGIIGYTESSNPRLRIIIYDYLAHLDPSNDFYWFRLAGNEALEGDYSNAIAAYHKAISINPQKKSYQVALSYCYQLKQKNYIK